MVDFIEVQNRSTHLPPRINGAPNVAISLGNGANFMSSDGGYSPRPAPFNRGESEEVIRSIINPFLQPNPEDLKWLLESPRPVGSRRPGGGGGGVCFVGMGGGGGGFAALATESPKFVPPSCSSSAEAMAEEDSSSSPQDAGCKFSPGDIVDEFLSSPGDSSLKLEEDEGYFFNMGNGDDEPEIESSPLRGPSLAHQIRTLSTELACTFLNDQRSFYCPNEVPDSTRGSEGEGKDVRGVGGQESAWLRLHHLSMNEGVGVVDERGGEEGGQGAGRGEGLWTREEDEAQGRGWGSISGNGGGDGQGGAEGSAGYEGNFSNSAACQSNTVANKWQIGRRRITESLPNSSVSSPVTSPPPPASLPSSPSFEVAGMPTPGRSYALTGGDPIHEAVNALQKILQEKRGMRSKGEGGGTLGGGGGGGGAESTSAGGAQDVSPSIAAHTDLLSSSPASMVSAMDVPLCPQIVDSGAMRCCNISAAGEEGGGGGGGGRAVSSAYTSPGGSMSMHPPSFKRELSKGRAYEQPPTKRAFGPLPSSSTGSSSRSASVQNDGMLGSSFLDHTRDGADVSGWGYTDRKEMLISTSGGASHHRCASADAALPSGVHLHHPHHPAHQYPSALRLSTSASEGGEACTLSSSPPSYPIAACTPSMSSMASVVGAPPPPPPAAATSIGRDGSALDLVGGLIGAAATEDVGYSKRQLRRLERARKAEAKKMPQSPLPADLQILMKKCEELEIENRGLKMQNGFANRQDSEHKIRIEQLELEVQKLKSEKKRLEEQLQLSQEKLTEATGRVR